MMKPGNKKRILVIALVVLPLTLAVFILYQGKQLYESFASPVKKWVKVAGGDHGNVLTTPMPLYATMTEWVLTHLGAPQ